jgi:hypothetical protein
MQGYSIKEAHVDILFILAARSEQGSQDKLRGGGEGV